MLALSKRIAARPFQKSNVVMYSLPIHARCIVPFRKDEKGSCCPHRKFAPVRSNSGHHHSETLSIVEDHDAARRELLALLIAAAVAMPTPIAEAAQPAALIKNYYKETDRVHAALRDVLAVEDSDPAKEAKFDVFRDESNKWIGDYRRLMGMSKKSFAETYAVINALQGSFTTLGTKRGLPDKVRNYSVSRLEAAEKALQREKSRDPNYMA